MQHCTNPSCPHRLAVGVAAEFDGHERTACSDCGGPLVSGAAARPDDDLPPVMPALVRRAVVSALGPLFLVALAQLVPLLGVEGIGGRAFDPATAGVAPSLIDLGLTPLIVVIVAMDLARRLLMRERPGAAHAWPAWRLAPLLVLMVAAVAAWAHAGWLAFPESTSRALVALTLVAGLALQVVVAGLTGAYGLAPGLSLVLAVVPLRYLFARLAAVHEDAGVPTRLLVALAATAGVALGTWWIATAHRRLRVPTALLDEGAPDQPGPYRARAATVAAGMPPVRLPLSGLCAFAVALSWLALDGIRGHGYKAAPWEPSAGDGVHPALLGVPLFAVVFAVLAWRRGPTAEVGVGTPRDERWLRALFKPALVRSVAWSGWVALLTVAAALPLAVVLATVVATGAVLDAADEWRARRRHDPLTRVAREERAGVADQLVAALARQDIPAHARGLHTRALLGDVGAFVPIEVLVPSALAGRARKVVATLPGGGALDGEAAAGGDVG